MAKTNIKSVLNLAEVNLLINSVTNLCFVDGEYRPENRIVAEKLVKIMICTDYFIENEVDAENIFLQDFYERFYNDDEIIQLVKDINGALDSVQANEIKTAINEKIEFKKQEMLNPLGETFKIINSIATDYIAQFKDVNVNEMLETFKNIMSTNKNDFAKAVIENFKNTDDKV